MNRLLVTVVLFSLASLSLAQTNAPAREFGAGFRKFYQLGLPDVAGGLYGRLEIQCIGSRYDSYNMDSGELQSLGISGNAWRIKDLGGGTNRYVYGGVAVVDAIDQKIYEKWVRQRQGEWEKTPPTQRTDVADWEDPSFAVGKWKAVDLKKDVSRIIAKLEKPDENLKNQFEYRSGVGGHVLLAAAQIYRLGMTNEANRIAERVFALHTDARTLLQEAVGILANAQYREAYAAFRTSRDWAAWHKSLGDILARFSSGWAQAPGVRKLAEMVKARVNNPEPPPPQGEGLSDEDRALARRLAVEPPSNDPFANSGQVCWIIPQRQSTPPGQGAGTNDVMIAIQERGMKSVPMLIALLRDSTFVQPDRNRELGPWAGSDAEDQTVEATFDSIDRPRTRGEIARSMLQPVLLLEERQRNEIHRMNADDFAAECEAWYKEYKGKTVQDLAKVYLEKGDESQRQYALNYFMQGTNLEANHAEVERMLLQIARESRDTPHILNQYVQRRKEKASNFVEQVAVVLLGTNAPAKPAVPRDGRLLSRRQLLEMSEYRHLGFVNQLRELVNVRSVKDLVAEYVSGTQSVAKAYARLQGQVSQQDPRASLDAILDGARKTDDPKKRVRLLGLMSNLRYASAGGGEQSESEMPDPQTAQVKSKKFDLAKHAQTWKALLEDKRGEDQPVNVAAAWAIEELYGDDENSSNMAPPWVGDSGMDPCSQAFEWTRGVSGVVSFLGERGTALLLERASARVAGKAVPELPSAEKVDAEQREKMLRTVTSATDVAAAVAKLSLDQQLALVEIGMTNRVLNAKLRPLADMIVEVEVRGEFKSAAGMEAKLKGRSFSKETVRTLLDVSRQLARDGTDFSLAMTRRPNVGGMEVVLFSPAAVAEEEGGVAARTRKSGTNRQEIVNVNGSVYGGSHSAAAWWPVEATARTRTPDQHGEKTGAETKMMDEMEAEIRTIDERQRKNTEERFWEEMDLIAEKVGAYAPAGVSFHGKTNPVVTSEESK